MDIKIRKTRWTELLKNRQNRILTTIVLLNIVATVLHYTDNVCFFSEYPEPKWLNPVLVDNFWFIMTPFAFLGLAYSLFGKQLRALISFSCYSLMSLLVLGHYLFAPFAKISLRIHLFIWVAVVAALVLLGYIYFRQLIGRSTLGITRTF